MNAEYLFLKDKTLPDLTSTDNAEFNIVITIIKWLLQVGETNNRKNNDNNQKNDINSNNDISQDVQYSNHERQEFSPHPSPPSNGIAIEDTARLDGT